MKGMSAVIAVVLILLITVSLAAAGYLFFSGIMGSTTQSATQSISQVTTAITRDFTIESVRGEKIYIRNIGQGELSGFSIYIDDTLLNTTNITIPQSEVRNITVYDFIDYSRPRSLKVATSGVIKTTAVGPTNQYPDLVGYWKFDEGSGTTASDSSGNGNNGNLNGNPTWVGGVYGKALEFNSSKYVAIQSSSTLNFTPYNKLTVEAYFNLSLTTTNYIYIIKKDQVFQLRRDNGVEGNNITFFIHDSNTPEPRANSYVAPDINRWYYTGGVFDGQKVYIYVNGTKKGESPRQTIINSTNSYVVIGPYSDAVVTIDEVRLWRRALTPEEVWNHYAHGPV